MFVIIHWIFIGRIDAEAEVPVLWLYDGKSWLIGKDPDAEKDWGQAEKGATEGEMVGWHHWLNAHEFEQTPGDGEGQGSLVCYSPWGCKELNMTERMNSKPLYYYMQMYSINISVTQKKRKQRWWRTQQRSHWGWCTNLFFRFWVSQSLETILFVNTLWWPSGKEFACQCRRHRFNPWVRKISWRRKWQPTPVCLLA